MHAAPVIEGYKILAKVGEGATSVVWKAYQSSLDRPVVIKVLSDKLSKEPADVKMFVAEAQTTARLRHSGIVQVYDFGQTKNDGCYFFVMEHVSGYTVGEWARRCGRLKELDALVIAHHVSEALKYAWDQAHVIHCDIKPDNLMVDADGTIKVMDLGLAHIVFSKGVSSGPDNDLVIGTPNYMSPEQALGNCELDCRTDIYALGMTLYHVLTGVLPYGNGDAMAVIEKQIRTQLESPRAINPDLSADITGMILKMTAKNKADRFQNWTEVLAANAAILHQHRAASAPDPVKHEPVRPRKKPHGEQVEHKEPQDDAEPSGDFKECPYCAEPIRKKAVYCRYCGKDIGKPSVKLRYRSTVAPIASPAAAPAAATTAAKSPETAAQEPEMQWTKKRKSKLGENFRMALSVLLLCFLVYYWYNRIQYERDVLKPWKTMIMRQVVMPVKEKFRKQIKNILEDQLAGVESESKQDTPPADQTAPSPAE